MGTLASCLKKIGLAQHEAAILRGAADANQKDGDEAHTAAVRAIADYIEELEAERDGLVKQILAQGGEAPAAPFKLTELAALTAALRPATTPTESESADTWASRFADFRSRMSALAERAMNAGDGALSGRISAFTLGMNEQNSAYMTPQWVEEVLAEREKMVARAEKQRAAQQPTPTPPAAPKAPEAQTPAPADDAEAEAKTRQKRRAAAEKEAFTQLLTVPAIQAAAANTPDNFNVEAQRQLAHWLGDEIARAAMAGDSERAQTLSELLADNKPVLPPEFFQGLLKAAQKARADEKRAQLKAAGADAANLAFAKAQLAPEERDVFLQGWQQALDGKTKSTLPVSAAAVAGYDAGSAWLATPEGRAAFAGRRGKKLENTGVDLRRWFDEQKAKINLADSTEAVIAALEAATSRAELLRGVLAESATPGARRWFELVRSGILPFKRWLNERGPLSRLYGRWSKVDSQRIQYYLDGESFIGDERDETGRGSNKTREERIERLRTAAQEYADQMATLAEALGTVASVESGARALQQAFYGDNISANSNTRYSEVGRKLADLFIQAQRTLYRFAWEGQGPKDVQSYTLRSLLQKENDPLVTAKKAALVPPRLDRVERDGEDYRGGQNVSPETFKRRFNFADVGFGQWVNARQDQDHLNYAHDAFLDLAKLLNLPAEAIALGGQLHFTIGALGHGKFAAHYAPAQPHPDGGTVPVINVTNTRGDGTLAHEWSHALDLTPQPRRPDEGETTALQKAIATIKADLKYAYDLDRIRASVINMLKGHSWWQGDKRAASTAEGRLANARQAILHYLRPGKQQSAYYREALKLDGSKTTNPYWSNDKELFARAFEAWAGDTLPGTSTYLVNPDWSGEGQVTDKTHRGTPYPLGEERERFGAWFDALAKSLVYDANLKAVRLDEAAWEKHRPRHREDWDAAVRALTDSLPELQAQVDADEARAAESAKEALAHAQGFAVGDWIRPRPDNASLAQRFPDPVEITGLKEVSGVPVVTFTEHTLDGTEIIHTFEGRFFQRVQSAAQAQAQAQAQAEQAAQSPAPAEAPSGELSDADLERLFDEAAAELAESEAETPEAAAPGENAQLPADWTREDVAALLTAIRGGQIVLVADRSLGIPTIHDFSAQARHMGFGTFQVSTPAFEAIMDGGGAMKHLPSGQAYTDVQISRGTFPYDRAAIIEHLQGLLGEAPRNPALAPDATRAPRTTRPDSPTPPPLSNLDAQVDQTAGKLIAEAAKLGVKGIDEALKGLTKLFGGGSGKLMSFPGGFNEETYRAAKPHFEAALQAFQAAGKTIKELFAFLIKQFGLGVKPYAIRFAKDKGLSLALGEKPGAARQVADFVQQKLAAAQSFTSRELFDVADRAYGGTQAEGRYSPKDAYDAMEVGVNQYLLAAPIALNVDARRAADIAATLKEAIARLPTQTRRDAEMDEFQQFSTPPALAYVANWVAKPAPGDVMLEPSAGTGDLAVWAKKAGAELVLNELASRRAALLAQLFPDARRFGENAEQLNNVLPADVRATVVVMNPPFSSTAGRQNGTRDSQNGARHVEQALKRLGPGGRLVAIVGEGMGPDRPAFRAWWANLAKTYNVRANIGISGAEYAKYGTTFDNRLLVIDHDGPTVAPILTGQVERVADLPALLEPIRATRPNATLRDRPGEPGANQPGSAPLPPADGLGAQPGQPPRPDPDAVGAGAGAPGQGPGRGPGVAPPAGGSTRPGGSHRPGGGGHGRGGQSRPGGTGPGTGPDGGRTTAAGESAAELQSGDVSLETPAPAAPQGELTDAVFENYTPQRLSIPGAKPHPGLLVQSAAMAAVEPPAPTYTPNLPKEIIDEGRLSLAQLESVVYAGQAHSQLLPNGERRGFFIGDGCVAAGTRIYNPITGQHTPIEVLAQQGKPHWVLSLTPEGFQPYLATMTFKKGTANLYRVVLDDGRAIIVTDEHRFLTPSGWATIRAGLKAGHLLASADTEYATPAPNESAYALHGWQKPEDCLGDCWPGSRPGDALLPPGVGSGPASAPSPADARGHNHHDSDTDDRALSPAHSARGLSAGHPAKNSSSAAASPALSSISGPGDGTPAQSSAGRRQSAPQSLIATVQPHPSGEPVPGHQSAPAAGLSPSATESGRRISAESPASSDLSRQTDGRAPLLPSPIDTPAQSLGLHQPVRFDGLFASDYQDRSFWHRVESIEFVRHDEFYDMYVPGPENYVAEGFVNHNTGVGKGREISGILLDNLRQGRTKAVWVSFNEGLIHDARRDFSGVGADPDLIFWQGKTKAGSPLTAKRGILFTTYSTLRGGEKKQAAPDAAGRPGKATKGKSRVDQIEEWLGKDFDGVIVFDEAHSLGNAMEMKGKRGKKKPAQQALAGIELQARLPKARIVYVSATGATELTNLTYAARLGLWGEGTPFADPKTFIQEVAGGGMAAMELVSRDMKALGMYIARSLSFEGVTYERLEHTLSPLQADIYNELARTWQNVLQNVDAALVATGQNLDGKAKSAALSRFWGTHQRFFNQIITAMQTPTVIEDMRRQIDAGNAVVIQLTNTNEAEQDRQAARAAMEDTPLEELDFTPRQALMDYVRNGFPVQAFETFTDDLGNTQSRPVTDASGNPVFDQDAVRLRDSLLATLEQIRVPENPIDAIINAFGSEQVGEVTGRKRRFVQTRDEQGNLKMVEEKRGHTAARADAEAFQADKKPILIFSQAGGTGYSFHADLTAKNQRRRVHYILQPGWRADSAVQGFGRSHRTNQASAPHYVLPTTNLKAQKRFVSSIARRLDQLGALTRGQRQATSQGLFSASDNLESRYADDALEALFLDMYAGRTPLDFAATTRAMGLNNVVDNNGSLNVSNLPGVPQFLNRLLSLEMHAQDAVFQEFEHRLDEIVSIAKQQGTFDTGLQTLRAQSIVKVRDDVAHTDERTGAATRYVELDVTDPIAYRSWDDVARWAQEYAHDFAGYFKDPKGNLFALRDLGQRVRIDGTVVHRGAKIGIRDQYPDYIDNVDEIRRGTRQVMKDRRLVTETVYTPVSVEEARTAWPAAVAAAPQTRTDRERMIVGVILPIWDRIKGYGGIVRLQTDAGERMIGRLLSAKAAKETLKNLGLGSSLSKLSAGELFAKIRAGARAILANGWEISKSRVSGEERIEIKPPAGYFPAGDRSILIDQGAFFERIQWTDRAFIPTGAQGEAIFGRIAAGKPVVELYEAGQSAGENEVAKPAIWRNTSKRYVPDSKTARPLSATETAFAERRLARARAALSRGARGRVPEVEAVAVVDAGLDRVASLVERHFHRGVVFYRSTDPGAHEGFYLPQQPDVVFVNVDGGQPLEQIAGHELLHALKSTQPGTYLALSQAVDKLVRAESRYADALAGAYTDLGRAMPSQAAQREELMADMAGRFFLDDQFWRDLSQQVPRSRLQRVLDVVREAFRRLFEALGLRSPVGVEERHLTNVPAARAAFAEAFRQFQENDLQHARQAMQALHEVMAEGEGAQAHFLNPVLGPVTLDYGQAGNPDQDYRGGFGAIHILARRMAEGASLEQAADTLAHAIYAASAGEIVRTYGNRVDVGLGGYTAVLSKERHHNQETWVLTGFKNDAGAQERATRLAHGYAPIDFGSRQEVGAAVNLSVERLLNEVKTGALPASALSRGREEDGQGEPRFAMRPATAYTEDHGLSDQPAPHRLIEPTELEALRRAAARLERPRDGLFLHVTEDGRAIATGQKGARIPERFKRFAEERDLAFEARRDARMPAKLNRTRPETIASKSEPMPEAYRASGARYFAEGNAYFDRTGEARFSIPLAEPQSLVQKLRDRVLETFDLVTQPRGNVSLWGKTFGTQYHKAQTDRTETAAPGELGTYGAVVNLAQQYYDDTSRLANEAADLAPGLLPKTHGLADVAAGIWNLRRDLKDSHAIAGPLFEGTLRDRGFSKEELKNPPLNELGKPMFAPLTDAQVELYFQARRTIDKSLDDLAVSEMSRLAKTAQLTVAPAGLTLDEAAAFYRSQYADQLDEARDELAELLTAQAAEESLLQRAGEDEAGSAAEREHYAVLREAMRGRHARERAAVEDRINDLQTLEKGFIGRADTIRGLKARAYAPLMRFGRYSVDVVFENDQGEPLRDNDGRPIRPFFGLFESKIDANRAAAALRQEYPDAKVTQGIMSEKEFQLFQGLQPETVALYGEMMGAAQDAAFQSYLKLMTSNRSVLRRLIHRQGIEGFAKDPARVLASFIVSNARAAAGNYHMGDLLKAVAAIPKEKGDVKDDAVKLVQYIQNPQEEAPMLRSWLFANFLGGSVAAAITNLTQTFTTTLPYLLQFGGNPVANITAAMKDATARMGKNKTKLADPDLEAALKRGEEEGVVAAQDIHMLMGESMRSGVLTSNRFSRHFMKAWGAFFSLAEQYNREVAFIAAYRVAQNKGMKGEEAYAFARKAVQETQFVYCVDTETECLTLRGWKRFNELLPDDVLMAVDSEGRAVESRLKNVHVFPGMHSATHFHNGTRRFSMVVTDGHDCLAQNYNSRDKKHQAIRKIKPLDLKVGHRLLRAPLAAVEGRTETHGADFAALLGWIAAEGHYAKFRNCVERRNVRLTQSLKHNPAYVEEIEGILQRLGGHYRKFVHRQGEIVTFTLKKPLSEQVLAAMPDKLLTFEMAARMAPSEMEALTDAFAKGDGCKLEQSGWLITQKVAQNLEVLQAMRLMLGKTATRYEAAGKDFSHLYLNLGTKRTAVEGLQRERVMVDTVWCPETEHGTWIARRNGATFVTGNSKVMKPNWARGALGSTLFTFKLFTINYLEFLKRLPRRERAIALAILAVAAGVDGLPFADDLDDLIDTIAQSLGFAWNTQQEKRAFLTKTFGEGAAGFIQYGLSYGLPLDLHSRLGVSNVIPGSAMLKRSESDKTRDVVEFLGAAGSVAKNAKDAFDRIQKDPFNLSNDLEAVAPLAPKAFADAYKGVRMAQQGFYTDGQGRRVIDTDTTDAWTKGFGFQPQRVAERQRADRIAIDQIKLVKEVTSDIQERWARGVFEKDPEKVADAKRWLERWNRQNPEARVVVKPAAILKRVQQMRLSADQRLVFSAPKQLRARLFEELQGAQ